MLHNTNFLCEIGTEEIPAGYIPPAIEMIKKILTEKLKGSRINFGEVEVFATPRRFAIMVSDLDDEQQEETVELKGPSQKAAYNEDGNPSKALMGFLKGNNLSLDNIYTKELDKGTYVFAEKRLESQKTEKIIPEIIESIIRNLTFPKQMRWSDKKILFPRPISYFLILFNDSVIDFEIDGIKSSNKTRGHYIQKDRMLTINKIKDYEKILEENDVIVNHKRRKEKIIADLEEAALKAGGSLNRDEELLDVVTFLVEKPYVAACNFNREFLRIPDIVLIAEMKEHQKYFSVANDKGGLSDCFLVVSNNPVTEHVKTGNVRVITARFNDARFFYEEDSRVKLIDRVDSLKSVLFHKDLGSIYDKVKRMEFIADCISERLRLEEEKRSKIRRAVLLCKTDLNTAMVCEFSSLQGRIGTIYALNDGEDPEAAMAINEHYAPRYHGDSLPEGIVSIVVSLSEKLDNIFGSFSVGNIPKGSQDPYALRRQANAIVEISISNNINLDLKDILKSISVNYKHGKELVHNILEFISARAKTIFADRGFRYDEIDACLSTENYDFLELYLRAKSINEFRKNERFSEMLLSFKRMNNIVSGFRKKNHNYKLKFSRELLKEKEEIDLYNFFNSKKNDIENYIKTGEYIKLFNLIIEGKGLIDAFFDKVLVMDENADVRDNRLYLLEDILSNFSNLMDFSRISEK